MHFDPLLLGLPPQHTNQALSLFSAPALCLGQLPRSLVSCLLLGTALPTPVLQPLNLNRKTPHVLQTASGLYVPGCLISFHRCCPTRESSLELMLFPTPERFAICSTFGVTAQQKHHRSKVLMYEERQNLIKIITKKFLSWQWTKVLMLYDFVFA